MGSQVRPDLPLPETSSVPRKAPNQNLRDCPEVVSRILCKETVNHHWICGIRQELPYDLWGCLSHCCCTSISSEFCAPPKSTGHHEHRLEYLPLLRISYPNFIRTRLFHFELLNSERTTLLPDDCSTEFQGLSFLFFLDVTKMLLSFLYCLAQSCQASTKTIFS